MESFFISLLCLSLILLQCVSGWSYQPPPRTNGNGQVTDRLVRDDTYTFRWRDFVDGGLNVELETPEVGHTVGYNIDLGINTSDLPGGYYNYTHTVTEPLNSNLTFFMFDKEGPSGRVSYTVVERDEGNASRGRPSATWACLGGLLLAVSMLSL